MIESRFGNVVDFLSADRSAGAACERFQTCLCLDEIGLFPERGRDLVAGTSKRDVGQRRSAPSYQSVIGDSPSFASK